MSWDSYVDNLTSTGHLDKAAIWGNTADSDWTGTAKNNFKLSQAEVKAIADSFKDTSDVKKVQSEGFYAGGQRYVVIRADDTKLYGKKARGADGSQSKEGVLVYKTNKALVIGHYPDGVQDGNAVNVLEPIGQYLIGIQY